MAVKKFVRRWSNLVSAMQYVPGENCEEAFSMLGIDFSLHNEEDCSDDSDIEFFDLNNASLCVAKPGDWIVKWENGTVGALDTNTFEALFKEYHERRKGSKASSSEVDDQEG